MNTSIVIIFLVFDMIVTVGIVFYVLSRRNAGGTNVTRNSGDFDSAPPSPFESAFSSPNSSDGDEIENLLRQGQKIQAIKLHRERTGVGLKEAKDAVEEIARRMR